MCFWRAEKCHYIINVLSWMKGLCICGAYERGWLYEGEWQHGILDFPSCLSRANRLYRSHSTVRSLTALALLLHHLYHVRGFLSLLSRSCSTGSILQAASKNQSLLDSGTPTPPAKACPWRPTEDRDRAARSSRDPHRTRVPNQRTAPTSALWRMSRPRQTRLLLLRKVKRSVQTCRH